ncbi:hypothetical protein [Streptomyces noursei]|uniref:hypothetical protein n=1 Tax=Streptomyces noursei TaxID=1971 RepID=UPI00167A994E|nr:hypothetical protein [Streptomyces noursei]MCZ1018991.1 hypothetical protein [Streptomyces noursei]GGX30687.1 hypothetical protein GCM10010341_60090 [Streptomyces noursei]
MFEVRKSIKRFRNDPAWTYQKKAQDYLATFERGGYPLSLGPGGLAIRDLLRGVVHGQEVSMFHLLAWPRRTGGGSSVPWTYSVAVLPLPRALPTTGFTSRLLSLGTDNWKRGALPRSSNTYTYLPNLGSNLVRHYSKEHDFAALINTYAMERLMHESRLGWRIEGNRMIGWTSGRKTYEDLLAMVDTLTTIVDGFPEQTWHWPG